MTFIHIVPSKHPEDYKLCTFKQVLIFIVVIFLCFRPLSQSKTKGNIHSFNQSINQSLNHPFIHSFTTFDRTHTNLVFLWHQSRNFRPVMSDRKLATPNNFIRGILAEKLDSFRLDFVSVSDERGSVTNVDLQLQKLTGLNSLKTMKI